MTSYSPWYIDRMTKFKNLSNLLKTVSDIDTKALIEKEIVSMLLLKRVRVINTTIFGLCMGQRENGMMVVQDEETHEIKDYPIHKLERAYDKF